MNICRFLSLEEQGEPVVNFLLGIRNGRNRVGMLSHKAVHYYVLVVACYFKSIILRADRNYNLVIPLGHFPAILMHGGLILLVIVFYD
jgi:hypothetical protein